MSEDEISVYGLLLKIDNFKDHQVKLMMIDTHNLLKVHTDVFSFESPEDLKENLIDLILNNIEKFSEIYNNNKIREEKYPFLSIVRRNCYINYNNEFISKVNAFIRNRKIKTLLVE